MDTTEDPRSPNGNGQNGNGNGQNGNGHILAKDDVTYSSGSQGRRLGEREYLALPGDNARRLFGRSQPEPEVLVDAHPQPRPRDAQGQVLPRKVVHDPALPDPADLRENYKGALELIGRWRPLRAVLLSDLLGRVEYALHRYRALKAEEERRFQNKNEEYRRADTWIDNRIGALRAERSALADQHDAEVATRQEALAQAREMAAVARVAAGLPVHYKDLDQEDESGGKAAQTVTVSAPPPPTPVPPRQSLMGKIGARLRGNPAEPDLNPASLTNPAAFMGAAVLPTRAYPDSVPFPMQDGLQQARPEEAIAVEQGLPVRSPAAQGLETRGHRAASWLALLACGSVFGISIGLLANVLDIGLLAIKPQKEGAAFAVVALLGVSLFWVLGQVVFRLAALASEERHSHLMASHRDDTNKVGDWLRRASYWSFGVLSLAAVALIAIEAQVERNGIVRVFVEDARNASMATGHGIGAASGPGPAAIFCLVLMVSLPFVLFHASEGWVLAREKTILQYLSGRRQVEGWHLAQECHRDRTGRTVTLFDTPRDLPAQTVPIQAPINLIQASPPQDVSQETVAEEGSEVLTAVLDAPAPTRPPEPPIRMVDVALAMERAREAYARLRETQARRRDALGWHDTRMAAYEQERQQERTEPENAGKLRQEDAYADYIGAVLAFDTAYAREMKYVERLMHGGRLMRLWMGLTRPPAQG